MTRKLVVYVDYGVYVDVPDDLDWDTDEGYLFVREKALSTMWEHGYAEVLASATYEIEDVSGEFEEDN